MTVEEIQFIIALYAIGVITVLGGAAVMLGISIWYDWTRRGRK